MSNKVNEQRMAELDQLVEFTLMGVLASLYESNLVKRVNMGKVVRLFGMDDSDLDDVWIDFEDPEFLLGYSKYKVSQVKRNKTLFSDKKNKLEDLYSDPTRILH